MEAPITDDLKKKIRHNYMHGEGSIQQIAIFYRVSVESVLDIIGETDLNTVTAQGDLIDQAEAGPEVKINSVKTFKVPFSTD